MLNEFIADITGRGSGPYKPKGGANDPSRVNGNPYHFQWIGPVSGTKQNQVYPPQYAHITFANASTGTSATAYVYDQVGTSASYPLPANSAFLIKHAIVSQWVIVTTASAQCGINIGWPAELSSATLLELTAASVTVSGTINTDVGQNMNQSGTLNTSSQLVAINQALLTNTSASAPITLLTFNPTSAMVGRTLRAVINLLDSSAATVNIQNNNAISLSVSMNSNQVLAANQWYVVEITIYDTAQIQMNLLNGSAEIAYAAFDLIPQGIYPSTQTGVIIGRPVDASGNVNVDVQAWNAGTLPVSISGTVTVSGSGTFNVALPTPSPLNATDFLGSVTSASAEVAQATGATSSTVGNLVTYNLACQAGLLTTAADNLTYVAIKGKTSGFYYAAAFLASVTSGQFWVAATEQLEIVTRNEDTVIHAMFGSFVEVPKR